jgi:hypothetical protein
MQDNQEALMITMLLAEHTWRFLCVVVDQNYMPKAWRMWVSIPVGGLKQLGKIENISKQSKIATSHKGLIDLKLEVKTGQSIEEINNGIDPFTEL